MTPVIPILTLMPAARRGVSSFSEGTGNSGKKAGWLFSNPRFHGGNGQFAAGCATGVAQDIGNIGSDCGFFELCLPGNVLVGQSLK